MVSSTGRKSGATPPPCLRVVLKSSPVSSWRPKAPIKNAKSINLGQKTVGPLAEYLPDSVENSALPRLTADETASRERERADGREHEHAEPALTALQRPDGRCHRDSEWSCRRYLA